MQRATLLASITGLWLSGCADLGDEWPSSGIQPGLESPSHRLARIHLRLQNTIRTGDEGTSTQSSELAPIQVRGHFAEYRGLVSNFVRAYIHAPEFAWEWLEPGQCGVPADLVPLAWSEKQREDDRELTLLDVGDIRWRYGNNDLDISLRLLPDLMPYVSGVEYFAESSWAESFWMNQQEDSLNAAHATLHIDGNGDSDSQSLVFSAPIPPALNFEFKLPSAPNQPFQLNWEVQTADQPESWLVLRLQGISQDKRIGEELVCLLSERVDNLPNYYPNGSGTINPMRLAEHGLDLDGDGLQITASRISESIVQVGAFANTELLIERQTSQTIRWIRESFPAKSDPGF